MDEEGEEEEELGFSRNYFLARELGASGRKKSARKLSDIGLVEEQALRAALAEIRPKHEEEIASLLRSYKDLYTKWLFELKCGFGLLMYGFGSKKVLLEDFASTTLTDCDVVVINGYLPSVNLKQLIKATLLICVRESTKSDKVDEGTSDDRDVSDRGDGVTESM
ncbi:hypothetical protein HPP92_015821 [Vanilla planifolia]|uniref:Origin recognition complex subunit 2 n=1 Tax=Vanilla planifolia TaxID=51239 RepID=A0A835PC34_VANPL|nr:hypothetical protein HPP92_027220 [Vanilla planifolia]KAG0471275.1 hypothetical protein HPP92_015821 [Vanilla planifolia]